MIKRLFSKITSSDKKNVFANMFSLTVLQSAHYILPLVTLPYLVRVLGPAKYGIVAFAQVFTQYFVIATDYGFNISAPRELSIIRNDKKKISEVFCSIMILKFIFLTIGMLLFYMLILTVPKFNSEYKIFFLSFGMVIGNILFPVWFFQGMEKMGYITALNIVSKLIFTICIFIFIQTESDYFMVPLLNSLGFISAGIIGLWIVFSHFKVTPIIPSIKALRYHLKNSFYFFLSRLSISIYTISNTFILGLFTTNILTGYYAAANKLLNAVSALNQPVINALYPYIARTKNKIFFKKIFFFWVVIGISIFLTIFFGNKIIISILYGEQYETTANILRLLSLQIPILFISVLLGLPFLAAFGYTKVFNFSVIFGSICHIIGLVLIIPLMKLYPSMSVYLLVFITLLTEIIVLSFRIYGVKKNSLW